MIYAESRPVATPLYCLEYLTLGAISCRYGKGQDGAGWIMAPDNQQVSLTLRLDSVVGPCATCHLQRNYDTD